MAVLFAGCFRCADFDFAGVLADPVGLAALAWLNKVTNRIPTVIASLSEIRIIVIRISMIPVYRCNFRATTVSAWKRRHPCLPGARADMFSKSNWLFSEISRQGCLRSQALLPSTLRDKPFVRHVVSKSH